MQPGSFSTATIRIRKAIPEDAQLLSELAVITFIASHGHSAPAEDIHAYTRSNYTINKLKSELKNPANIYHLITYDQEPAGFSKICLNSPHEDMLQKNIAKLDRIYLLEKFQGLSLGKALLDFNIALCKENSQSGLWLYVWVKNETAIRFYKKAGFRIVGSFDFRISETHTNPNHRMLLEW